MPKTPTRDRIVELRRVPAGELRANPRNWRRHPETQATALRSVLETVGYAGALLARETPDGLELIDGHLRREIADDSPLPVLVVDLDEDEAALMLATLDPLGAMAETDEQALFDLLQDVMVPDAGLAAALEELTGQAGPPVGLSDPDEIPAVPVTPITQPGDLWVFGNHRLLCADTTDPEAVSRLVDGREVRMIHADPPYGMGKESEGIANDNLHKRKLDTFQMEWWRAWSGALAPNGSTYIWGTAEDLWRLWYAGGLGDVDDLMVRNEIVWDKGVAIGMASPIPQSFPTGSERCLFLMRGEQFLGSQNTDEYWEGYEQLRSWLETERDKAGWTNQDVNRLTETFMAGHWFTRSQFQPIPRRYYERLQAAATGRAFTLDYDDLSDLLLAAAKEGGNAHRRELSAQLRDTRSWFDNTHEFMRDVWQFPVVMGEDRFEHATPKPVAMVARAIASSCPPGSDVAAPFAGTGPEFIAAEQLDRRCVGMEINAAYCDVIVKRWETFTGQTAVREEATVRAESG